MFRPPARGGKGPRESRDTTDPGAAIGRSACRAPYAFGVVAGWEIALSPALLDRTRESIGLDGPAGYHVDELDLRTFGGLAAVQHQVVRAQIPQVDPGTARDEALAAETLYRLNDTSSQPAGSGPTAMLVRPRNDSTPRL
jgi:hypothetical protein